MPAAALVAGVLVSAGGAQAAAPTHALSEARAQLTMPTARKLAHRLVAKQRRERSLVFAHLGRAHRVSSSRIDFPYRDRSTENALCRATIVVTADGGKRSAEIADPRCHGISGEVLAFERASRSLGHDVAGARDKVRRSLRRYRRSLPRCDSVAVPRNRRRDADVLIRAGAFKAFYGPLRDRLASFDTQIDGLNAWDPVMVDGVHAWDRTIALIDSLPASTRDPCGALRKWADDGWSSDSAPADFQVLRVVPGEFRAQEPKLAKARRHMATAGVTRYAATSFTLRGLMAIVDRKLAKHGL